MIRTPVWYLGCGNRLSVNPVRSKDLLVTVVNWAVDFLMKQGSWSDLFSFNFYDHAMPSHSIPWPMPIPLFDYSPTLLLKFFFLPLPF